MEAPVSILYLEDDPDDAVLVRAAFEGARLSCRLTVADSQEEYLEALAREPFDLILSDFTLPSFDGYSALALARSRCPETPFLFYSGTLPEEDARVSLRAGAAGYVLKSSGTEKLVAAVRDALKSRPRRPPKDR